MMIFLLNKGRYNDQILIVDNSSFSYVWLNCWGFKKLFDSSLLNGEEGNWYPQFFSQNPKYP